MEGFQLDEIFNLDTTSTTRSRAKPVKESGVK